MKMYAQLLTAITSSFNEQERQVVAPLIVGARKTGFPFRMRCTTNVIQNEVVTRAVHPALSDVHHFVPDDFPGPLE